MNENEPKSRVISTSTKKNVQMVVYHNVNERGVKQSITRFEPLNPNKPAHKRQFNGKGAR